MANGDCPVGAANQSRITTLEREMGEIKQEQHELRNCVQTLVTEGAVRKAGLDRGGQVAVATITGIVTLVGILVNAAIVLVAR